MVSPVNASRLPSRVAAHHSGPERLAKPYSVEDFHLLILCQLRLALAAFGQKQPFSSLAIRYSDRWHTAKKRVNQIVEILRQFPMQRREQ